MQRVKPHRSFIFGASGVGEACSFRSGEKVKPVADNAYWFARTAQAIRDIVDEHGGAVIMTRPELCEAVMEEDPHLSECHKETMETIFQHITCCLKRVSLACCAYQGLDPSVLLIFDVKMSDDAAKAYAEEQGLSEAVQIELFDLMEVSA